MSTPNSGTTEINVATNLGDVSKLAFLNDIPMDDTQVAKPEAPAAPQGRPDDTGPADEIDNTAAAAAVDDDSVTVPLDLSEPAPEPAAPEPTASPRTPAGVVSADKSTRDYSDIAPEDVPYFKQMSNSAFEVAKNWYKSHRTTADVESKYSKELNELRDFRFYQHPEAYKLSPDYNNAAKEFRTQAQIIQHYTNALERLEAGEPINDIGMDENGNLFIVKDQIQPSPALKAQVSVALQRAMSAQHAAQAKLEGVSTTYQSKSKEFEDLLSKATDSLVSPTLLKDKAYTALYDRWVNNVIPPHLQNVPVFKQMAKMAAFIQLASKAINATQQKAKSAAVKQTAIRQQGPGDGLPASGPSSLNDMPVADVLKEFAAMRNR